MSPGSHSRPTPPRHLANKRHQPVPEPLARLLVGCGRVLIGLGILVLAFAGFQLWGTGLVEARAQEELTARFRAENPSAPIEPAEPVDPSSGGEPAEAVGVDPPTDLAFADDTAQAVDQAMFAEARRILASLQRHRPPPTVGDPVAVLSIPAIGVAKTVVEGTTRDALRSGPGHYRATPLPGQPGNVAIAGHRTTHGAPFLDIDRLVPGDEIAMETPDGVFTYLVEGQPGGAGGEIGHRIVDPDDVGVIADQGDDRLTLTACHPKYSARQRIIVTAVLQTGGPATGPDGAAPSDASELEDDPVIAATNVADEPDSTNQTTPANPMNQTDPATNTASDQLVVAAGPAASEPATMSPPAVDEASMVARSLGWQRLHAGPALAWAGFAALIAIAGWGAGRLWRRVPAYAMAVPPFTLALFSCFANLERLLPAA